MFSRGPLRPLQNVMMNTQHDHQTLRPDSRPFWRRTVTLAGLAVLGVTPWAQAQQPLPDFPAFCPPLTAFATPTLFDVWFGTAPIRFPF